MPPQHSLKLLIKLNCSRNNRLIPGKHKRMKGDIEDQDNDKSNLTCILSAKFNLNNHILKVNI